MPGARVLTLIVGLLAAGAAHGQLPTIVDGAEDRILLHGAVVGPSGVSTGDVLVEGNLITCVAASCAAAPGAAGATRIDVQGAIYPGLIDTWGLDLFGIFDGDDWSPSHLYANHNQWPNETRYQQMIDADQYLTGFMASPVDIRCEIAKYAEVRALMAGTTSVVTRATSNFGCLASLVRSVDLSQNDLGFDKISLAQLLPTTASADTACSNFASGTTAAYLPAVGEGVDSTALSEFTALFTRPTIDGCLFAPQTSIVHGTAFGTNEFGQMAAAGMGLVWTPRSDVRLYGGTADIAAARSAGVGRIALATGDSFVASSNLLDALRFADDYDRHQAGNTLSAQDLFRMVTSDAARVLALDAYLGSIEVGKRADLLVLPNHAPGPYESLLDATPGTVRLVMVDGRVLYGDAALDAAGPASPGCESATVEGAAKFLCVAETSSANQLDQTFASITSVIDTELASYDVIAAAQGIAPFGPKSPLVAAELCGNAVLEGGERCDDGNTANGDGCASTCALEVAGVPGLGPLARAALALTLLGVLVAGVRRASA